MDNRNSSAVKRARSDGNRRDDDWTCPSCGNVNFSFRTTCNMRNCTQPRPADRNSKTIVKILQAPHGFLATLPYLGSGTPSSMFMGVPPYSSSAFPGSSLPPYDVPFSGGSAFPYNYGNRFSGGSPYRAPLHLSGPPYSSGPMMANVRHTHGINFKFLDTCVGGLYGIPPMIEQYGLNFPISPGSLGPRPGFFPDVNNQRSTAEASPDDDWTCPNCGNVNFSFRSNCNMRMCNTPKPVVSRGRRMDKNPKPKIPVGSWKCDKCGNINYPFRTNCNRQSCGAEKTADTEEPAARADNETEQ